MRDLEIWRDASQRRAARERAFTRLLGRHCPMIERLVGAHLRKLRRQGVRPPSWDEAIAAAIYGHGGAGGFLTAVELGPADPEAFVPYAATAIRNALSRANWNAPSPEGRSSPGNAMFDGSMPLDTDLPRGAWWGVPDPKPTPELELIQREGIEGFLRGLYGLDKLGLDDREAQAVNAFLADGKRADVGKVLGVSERHGGRLLDSALTKLGAIDPQVASARPRRRKTI